MSAPPKTAEEILATGNIDPAFTHAAEQRGSISDNHDVAAMKRAVNAMLPSLQDKLAASRPADIVEKEHSIPLDDKFKSRMIVCRKSDISSPSPIIILHHGGGHCIGHPEFELGLARELALRHSATVICPSFRLAPEHPFPASVHDAWWILQYIAKESTSPHDPSAPLLPPQADPKAGFIVGGSSAGANLSAVIAHLARDNGLDPPLTGQFLSAGSLINELRVPEKYKPYYLSWEQNKNAPMMTRDVLQAFRNEVKADPESPLAKPFDQHHPADAPGEVKQGHMGLPPAYFQACGADFSRDDSLIYERVLREECGIPTRIDLYSGFPHCWWAPYPELEMSKKRMEDSVQGIGWLLSKV